MFELRSVNGQPLWNAKSAPSQDRSVYRHSEPQPQQICLLCISLFSPLKASSTCSFCFKVSLDQKEAIDGLCFPRGIGQAFRRFSVTAALYMSEVTEDLQELDKYAKPPFLTLETSLLCSRCFLYSLINLYWQLQLTRWNIKRDKWSRLKNTHQLLGKVILVFMLASHRLLKVFKFWFKGIHISLQMASLLLIIKYYAKIMHSYAVLTILTFCPTNISKLILTQKLKAGGI